jgi:hypothetical protein
MPSDFLLLARRLLPECYADIWQANYSYVLNVIWSYLYT